MNDSYLWVKFYLSVRMLALGEDSLQARMADAYLRFLQDVDANHLPERFQAKFREMQSELAYLDPNDNASIRREILSWPLDRVSVRAEMVLEIYSQLTRSLSPFYPAAWIEA